MSSEQSDPNGDVWERDRLRRLVERLVALPAMRRADEIAAEETA